MNNNINPVIEQQTMNNNINPVIEQQTMNNNINPVIEQQTMNNSSCKDFCELLCIECCRDPVGCCEFCCVCVIVPACHDLCDYCKHESCKNCRIGRPTQTKMMPSTCGEICNECSAMWCFCCDKELCNWNHPIESMFCWCFGTIGVIYQTCTCGDCFRNERINRYIKKNNMTKQ